MFSNKLESPIHFMLLDSQLHDSVMQYVHVPYLGQGTKAIHGNTFLREILTASLFTIHYNKSRGHSQPFRM
jgi:hypothetical protein